MQAIVTVASCIADNSDVVGTQLVPQSVKGFGQLLGSGCRVWDYKKGAPIAYTICGFRTITIV